MDFIVGLPKTKFILVVIDKLTKVAHFIYRNIIDDAPIVSSNFGKEIIWWHGFIEEILFDRDLRFTFEFWKSLYKALGTKLNISSSYHTEIDGKIEQVNQFLEDMLRMYYVDYPTKWEDYLYFIEFAYNNDYHSYLGMAPFEALYGQKCRTPLSLDNIKDWVTVRNDTIREMEEQIKGIWKRLKEVENQNKSYADLKRTPMEFSIGDKVFLRVKIEKSTIKYSKLALRYVGPFSILNKISPVAYKIKLQPNLCKIHDSFHVFLLKKYVHDPLHVWDVSTL